MERARRFVWYGILITVIIGAGFFLFHGWKAFAGPYDKESETTAQRVSAEAYRRTERANAELLRDWRRHQVFTGAWWINVALTLCPWLIWGRVRPKKSTYRLLFTGAVMIVLSSYQDFIGVTFGFWRYHIQIVPSIPSYFPWDFTLYPVSAMLFVQTEPRLSMYFKGVLFACVASFVVEPTFILLEYYEPVRWSAFYSLPIHYANYLVAHWAGTRSEFQPLEPQSVPIWSPPQA